MLVFLAASAGAGVVGEDLFRRAYGARILLLLVELLAALLRKQVAPCGQVVEPVSLCAYHVVIELFLVKVERYFGILGHVFDGIGCL